MDVRIVGGGFAGTVTALQILHRVPDARVTIYEREKSPHTTLCGEGLSDDTLRFFQAFDSTSYIAESFDEASWFFPEDVECRVHQRGHTMARERWIPAMAEAAQKRGAEYRTDAKLSAEQVAQMAREADLVVGCDGPGSVTRKVVGGRHETMLGIQYRVAREGRVPSRLEFYTDKRYSPEYAWVFPRGDIMNVGLLAQSDGQDWARLDRFMADKQITGRVLKREAYPIGFFGDKVQRGNVVLVGDAAGLTNPITKGGMSSVVYASDILASCLAEGKLAEYERRILRHPMTDRSFRPALEALRRWSNDEFAQLTRFAPKLVHVHPDVSTERAYFGVLAKTILANLGKMPDVLRIVHALGVSRKYSW